MTGLFTLSALIWGSGFGCQPAFTTSEGTGDMGVIGAVDEEEGDAGVYTVTVMVSTSNAAETGDKTISVSVWDAAGNETTNASAIAIRFQAETSFTIALHAGVNLMHVPVKCDGLDHPSDLFRALGVSDRTAQPP